MGTGVGCGAGVRIGCGPPVDVAVARPVEAGVEPRVGVRVAPRLADEPGDVGELGLSVLDGSPDTATLALRPGDPAASRPPMSAGSLEGAG